MKQQCAKGNGNAWLARCPNAAVAKIRNRKSGVVTLRCSTHAKEFGVEKYERLPLEKVR